MASMEPAAAAPDPPRTRMTLEEWADMPEDEPGELVDGELVEEEMPGYAHEVVVAFLIHALLGWLGKRGVVGGSDAKFAVKPTRGRKPDLTVYLSSERLPPRRGV